MRRILKGLAGLTITLGMLVLVIYLATGPQLPAVTSASANWLGPGPLPVGQNEFIFVDETRPTDDNRGNPGSPNRTFPTTVWYPENTGGSHPLIIHSHGIMSSRTEMTYMLENLASHGYIIAATDYPLTNGGTPGGANATDVVNQPADVSFLIDSVIALEDNEKPFEGLIDINRIGLTGLSLGGLTTTLTTYHPRWRDPRIKAAVSIAGPSAMFTEYFYTTSDIPFLMIAGTSDALIDHKYNAAIIPERIENGILITIEGGSHLGFIGLSDPLFRFMNNPDSIGCQAVLAVLDQNPDDMFLALGTRAEGVVVNPEAPDVCEKMPLLEASHPGQQKLITQIAVLSFFESVFGKTENERATARDQLQTSLALDFEQVSFTN